MAGKTIRALTAGNLATYQGFGNTDISLPVAQQSGTADAVRFTLANFLTLLGAQPTDATLTAFAALTIAANSLSIGTGADAFAQTTFAANRFPARASTGNIEAKTITDHGLALVDDADAAASQVTIGLNGAGPVVVGQGYAVGSLPAAGTAGRRAWVTDALAPVFLTTVVGGGAVVTPVFDDGSTWVAG